MKISANIGELSEIYVLVRLLSEGKIYTVGEDLKRNADCFLPILKIFREENKNHKITFEESPKNKIEKTKSRRVKLYLNGSLIREIETEELANLADSFYSELKKGDGKIAAIAASDVMEKLECTKVKAPSSDKTDITLEVHDPFTNYDRICGYSIKSDLGGKPTLFNASQATNFKFEVADFTDSIEKINAISTRSKIRDRMKKIKEIKFFGVTNETFSRNLLFIDTQLEKFLAQILILYYGEGLSDCATLATLLEERDPLSFGTKNLYRHKLKKFLCAVALGLNPSKTWNGLDEANGGYIVVLESGEVVAYHLHERNGFENYLLNNTRLDTPSTKKHRFGKIYPENGKFYINLNLQIRFK